MWVAEPPTLNDRFFEKLFLGRLIFSRSFARNLLRGNLRRNILISYFLLMPYLEHEPWLYVCASTLPARLRLLHRNYFYVNFSWQWSGHLVKVTCIIGYYNTSVRITDLVSHTTHVVCINFRRKWLNLQFNVDSAQQIIWETFHGSFNYSQIFARNLLRGNRRRNIFLLYLILMSGLGLETRLLRLISQHTTH